MPGKVTIKDGAAIKYEFQQVTNVMHDWAVKLDKWEAPGNALPPIDHNKTVVHIITVEFELIDQGTYDGGEPLGSTGDIWEQRSFLKNLSGQATNNYYTLIEEDDTIVTSGWNGVVEKILAPRAQETQQKIIGSLVFVESDDVYNF